MINESSSVDLPNWIESVWQSNSSTIYKLCEIKCRCSDDAKDLFQTVALKFCQNAGRLISREFAFPWLLKVVHNSYCDMVTNRNVAKTVLFLREPSEAYRVIPQEDGLFFSNAKEDLADYENLLATLKPLEKLIVEMSYAGGLTCTEIGRVVGLSENAIRKRRHVALGKLREKLLEEGKSTSKFRNFIA